MFSCWFCYLVSIGSTIQLELVSLRSQLSAFTKKYMFVKKKSVAAEFLCD